MQNSKSSKTHSIKSSLTYLQIFFDASREIKDLTEKGSFTHSHEAKCQKYLKKLKTFIENLDE